MGKVLDADKELLPVLFMKRQFAEESFLKIQMKLEFETETGENIELELCAQIVKVKFWKRELLQSSM